MSKKKMIFECIKNMNEHAASIFLLLLLCGDFVFLAFHLINSVASLKNSLLSVTSEGGYAEIYQYIKWYWIIILFTYLAISRRSFSYIAWALVFTYFLFDDALQIHEFFGKYMTSNLTLALPFGLEVEDLGELAVSAVAGMILLFLVVWSYLHGSQDFKKMSHDLLLLIIALVFFGVFVDLVHSVHWFGRKVRYILGVTEDGGEMLVASLMLWYVFLLSVRKENTTSYLYDFVQIFLPRRSS